MPFQNAASAMWLSSVSYKIQQKPCDALHVAPVCCCASDICWFRHAASILQCAFFSSERGKSIRAFQISFQILQTSCTLHMLANRGTIFTLYIYGFCTEGCLHIGMPSHMSAFTQRCFSQRLFLHKVGALTQGLLYVQVLLHRDDFFRRSFYSQTRRYFYTDAATQRRFCTGILLHASTCAFTIFYTGIILTQSSLYTQKLLHKSSYAEMVPTQNAFAQRRLLHTDIFVQRGVFLHCRSFFQRDAFTRVLSD